MIAVLEVGLRDLAWNPLSRSFGRTVEERGLLLIDNDSDGCFQLRSEETRIRREDPGARSIRARRVFGEFSVQDKISSLWIPAPVAAAAAAAAGGATVA